MEPNEMNNNNGANMNNNMNNDNMNNGMNNGAPKKKSGMGMWIAVILIIVIGLLVIFGARKRDADMMPAGNTAPDTTVNGDMNGTNNGVNEETSGSPAATLSYTNALKQYAGKTLQFDGGCQVNPTSAPIFKAGTSIMLDNRSAQAKTVKIGSSAYSLGAYGFRIASLSTAGTYRVDCGTSQNVITLTVAK